MENIVCWAIFSNPYRDNGSKTKYLVKPTFSLHFFALSPQKHNEWLTNTLRFLLISFLCWSIASEWHFLTNYTSIFLMMLVAFLPSGSLWQLSISKAFTSVLESLPILLLIISSIFWSETSFQIPDISTFYICCIVPICIAVFQDLLFYFEGFDWNFW